MVEKISLKDKYSDRIEHMNKIGEESFDARRVELFFSFDIVNSSLYKTANYIGWAHVLTTVFDKLRQIVTRIMPGAELWRVLGDEVIFIIKLREVQDCCIYVDNIFEILNEMVNSLKTSRFYDDLDFSDEEKTVLKLQNIISIQASSWIAIIKNKCNKIGPYDNIFESYQIKGDYRIFEFLGNDIDTGFRIKKETQDRRLVLSFELAYLISKNEKYIDSLNIITYKKLKGIWQGRLYPIIWYHNSRLTNDVKFNDSFYYDESERSELVMLYHSNRTQKTNNSN